MCLVGRNREIKGRDFEGWRIPYLENKMRDK